MGSYNLEEITTRKNFSAVFYLDANPDVAQAIEQGNLKSAWHHFKWFGRKEGRTQRLSSDIIKDAKQTKLERIRPLLRDDLPFEETGDLYDFLSDELRTTHNIVDVLDVSSHHYDADAGQLIAKYPDGMLLDCGAGRRPIYFDNVVNFEIVPFDTTDVLGVGEELPFRDNSFQAVISIAVLEHVKDPFRCASEIARVLKPGGELYCSVPFLQPLHGYPHHYYNMSHQGLRNLFDTLLKVDDVDVSPSGLPLWSMAWILKSWANGLRGNARRKFLGMRIKDFIGDARNYVREDFVTELPREKNLELASGCTLHAHKPK